MSISNTKFNDLYIQKSIAKSKLRKLSDTCDNKTIIHTLLDVEYPTGYRRILALREASEELKNTIQTKLKHLETLDKNALIDLSTQKIKEISVELEKLSRELAWWNNEEYKAKFSHWCKLENWTAQEAIILSLGLEPDKFKNKYDKLKQESNYDSIPQDLRERETQLFRSDYYRNIACQLPSTVKQVVLPLQVMLRPINFVMWMHKRGMDYPAPLNQIAKTELNNLAASKTTEQLEAENAQLKEKIKSLEAQLDTTATLPDISQAPTGSKALANMRLTIGVLAILLAARDKRLRQSNNTKLNKMEYVRLFQELKTEEHDFLEKFKLGSSYISNKILKGTEEVEREIKMGIDKIIKDEILDEKQAPPGY